MARAALVLLSLFSVSLSGAQSQNAAAPTKSLGVPIAPIIVEVFSDYQCPGCKALYEQTIRPLIANYVNQKKIYFVHRDYPLPIHQYAREAACYACAAERVGKYEQACEVLFRNQDAWAKDGKVDETVCSVMTPAEAKKVQAMAKSPDVLAEINRDIEAGRTAGIGGTPTMVITHKGHRYPVSGVVSYAVLQRFLDDLATR